MATSQVGKKRDFQTTFDDDPSDTWQEAPQSESTRKAPKLDSSPSPAAPAVPTIGNLDNPIHPIFRRSNFELDDDHEYDVMRAGLQLVSLLISPPSSLAVFRTIFFGRLEKEELYLHPPASDGRDHFQFTELRTKPDADEITHTEQKLAKLADIVRVVVVDGDESGLSAWDMSADWSENSQQGEIKMTRAAINTLNDASARLTATGDDRFFILHSFLLARTLGHELAHLAYSSVHQHGSCAYFPGVCLSEDGFEWEADVFGGLIECIIEPPGDDEEDGEEEIKFFIAEWPNPKLPAAYMGDSSKIGVRLQHSEALLAHSELIKLESWIGYCIPSNHIKRLFRKSFWKRVERRGPSELHPEPLEDEFLRFRFPPESVQILTKAYESAKGRLEAQVGDSSEFERLIEPWERFVADHEAVIEAPDAH